MTDDFTNRREQHQAEQRFQSLLAALIDEVVTAHELNIDSTADTTTNLLKAAIWCLLTYDSPDAITEKLRSGGYLR